MSRKLFLLGLLLLALTFRPSVISQSAQPQVNHQAVVIKLSDLSTTSNDRLERDTTTIETPVIAVPSIQAEPFLAVAPLVKFMGPEDGIILRYRASSNAGEWTNWADAVIDRDVTPRGSGRVSTLIFLPSNTAKVQFQLRTNEGIYFTTSNITDFRVSFINPGRTSPKSKVQPSTPPALPQRSAESSLAKFPKPSITTRTDWGCPDGQGNPRATPSYTTVSHLIVHHTAGSNSSSDWAAVVRSIWNYHIFTNGWSDVGYNYLIDPNGVIYEGRGGGDNVIGAHFSCQNGGTMGVALLGTFTSIQPSAAAINSLQEILSWKADQRNIDPAAASFHNGMQQSLPTISGHRDGNGLARSCTTTECPGDFFYPQLANLRTETNKLVKPINDFVLSTTTDKQVAAKGTTATFGINSAIAAGVAQTINLSLRNLPTGFTATFSAPAMTTGNAAQLTIKIPDTAASGNYPLTVLAVGSTKRAVDISLNVTGTLASVSAASYQKDPIVAADSIVSAFGVNLAAETKAAESRPLPLSLADVSLKIKDSSGLETAVPLFFVSPNQINYLVPATIAKGVASISVFHKSNVVASGTLEIVGIAPGVFSANANGQGAAVGALQRRQANGTDIFEALTQYDETQKLFVPRPLDLQTQSEQFFLTLYGTGIRFRNPASSLKAQIGTTEVEVLYAGEQKEFFGLDQINLQLPTTLKGKGTVELRLLIEDKWTNPLLVSFR